MTKKQARQAKILTFLKGKGEVSITDILNFLGTDVDRKTVQRDLNELEEKLLVSKKGAGRMTTYSSSEAFKILEEIDVNTYFKTPYLERDALERFNFEIFNALRGDIFTATEKEKLENLQGEFIKNFSNYESQTLINKEFERIMIEFSWKSSAIEGNTYTLLATEALIKNNVVAEGKTKEETQMILKYKPLDNSHQIKDVALDMVGLINNKESFFEKAFLALVLISYIQIFEDGNKRTARTVSNAMLLAHNSIPLSYRIVDVEEYKKAMILFYEINNLSYFKKIFIAQLEDAVTNYFK